MGVLPPVAIRTTPLPQVTNLSLPPGLCFTPSASPERVYRPPIPLLRGKHKTRLDWFLISTGMW